MMRFVFSFALLWCFLFSDAQDSSSFSRWSIYCQPSDMINPWLPAFTLGVQYQVGEYVKLDVQGGLIKSWFCIPYVNTENNVPDGISREEVLLSKKGYKINGAVKVYPLPGTYFALQFIYNNYEKTDKENIWRFAQSYTQRVVLHKSITDVGGIFKMGYVLEDPLIRVYIEAYGGVGLKYKTLKLTNGLPEDAEIIVNEGVDNGGNIFNDVTGSRLLPVMVFGVIVGFKL